MRSARIENRLKAQQELLINNDMRSDFIKRYLKRLPVKGDRIDSVREDFLGIEGHASKYYFREYLKQFPEWIRPKSARA